MESQWHMNVTADSNHLKVAIDGYQRIGSTWLRYDDYPLVDLICDPEEDPQQLLKDALVAVIERL